MAAGNWKVFGSALRDIHKADLDLDGAFRMALVTASSTPDQDVHDTWSDISANEVANGNGYATHGKVASITVSLSGHAVTVDAADQSWTASTITAKWAVIVHDANNDGALAGTDKLLCFADLNTSGGSLSSTNNNFDVTINAAGVFVSTASST